MSSGAYFIEVPLVLLGGAVGLALGAALGAGAAVGALGVAAGSALGDGSDALRDVSANAWAAAEDARRKQQEIAERIGARDAEVKRVQEAVDAVLTDIAQLRESLKTLNFQYCAKTATFAAREQGVSTEMTSNLKLEDMMFMEVDVRTQQITYVVLDYSDTISLHNAKNSMQFKKLALASDLMKKIMIWVVDNPQEQQKLNQLIAVVNEMLDDHSISFNQFQQFVQMRIAEFQRIQDAIEADPQMWDQYCSLCAMRGERPRRLRGEALVKEVRALMEKVAADKFVAAARKAFLESVREMGLEVRSDHMLDQVPGMLLVDKENPAYSLFYSEHDVSFMLEMVETGEADGQQRKNVCDKRRELERRMLEKGYRLKLCASDDEVCATLATVEEKRDVRQSNAERLRRRRALAGKQAKLKMAGGN